MNVFRGSIGSLMQRGLGSSRAGPMASITGRDIFSGLSVTSERDERASPPSSFLLPASSTWAGQLDMSRRFLSTRARAGSNPRGRKPRMPKPSMDIARAMPLSVQEMANTELITLGAMGNSDALKEILKRHIMTVDNCSYETACETFAVIASKNREGMWVLTVPYKIGMSVALVGAFGSFPMVFDFGTVFWFNEGFVTADVPEPKDLETALEVGSWAWNWMEPPLGTMSFFLLCLQYVRAQFQNIGIKPYTEMITKRRAEKLAAAFPQYDKTVVMNFAESVSFYGDKDGLQIPLK